LSSVHSGKDGDVISAFKAADGAACVSISHDDMAFIEAAHPGAVIELIERLEAVDKDGREYAILAGTNAARAEKAERERDVLKRNQELNLKISWPCITGSPMQRLRLPDSIKSRSAFPISLTHAAGIAWSGLSALKSRGRACTA